jgi:hypothetical protein
MVGPPPLAPTGSLRARRPALLRAHRPASSAPARRGLHRPAPPSVGSGRAAWLLRLARSAPWAPPPRANGGKGMAELQRERAERQFSAPSRGFSSSQPIFRAILCGSSFLDAFGRAPPKTASPRALPNGPFARILIGVNLSNLRPHLSFCLFNLLLSE